MKRIAKRIFSAVLNRMTITALMILIQLYYVIVFFFLLAGYATWVGYAFYGLAMICSLYIIWKDFNPAYKIGWILLVNVLPVMGVPLYLLFGDKKPARRLVKRLSPVEEAHRVDLAQRDDLSAVSLEKRQRRTSEYVTEKGPYPSWSHTATRYYPLGDELFEDMLEDLALAEHFIFMEYFIISKGELWDEIVAILKQKAREGVDVRIIYDDLGSMKMLPRRFSAELNEAGIQVLPFNTVRPFLSLVYNNRDHRKICVVDGYIGYVSGANLADEYANKVVHFGHWKDSGVRLYGEAVWNLSVMFLNMWNSFRKTDDSYESFSPHVYHPGDFASDGVVQPFSDTPLDNENLSENVYLEIINQAEDYVFIYTPYLIPSSEMETALELAAKRGVDVRIVTPGIPDKPLIFMITRSYYRKMMEAGVKIYEYTPGFIHAKNFVSDDRIAVIGTINIDFRSLFLHFECGTLLIENSSIAEARSDAIETFAKSHLVTEEDLKRFHIGTLIASLLRVLSPIL